MRMVTSMGGPSRARLELPPIEGVKAPLYARGTIGDGGGMRSRRDEGVMASPCCWQGEPIGNWRYLLLDAKGAISFRVQLAGMVGELQMSSI